jgi:hypothetical protein
MMLPLNEWKWSGLRVVNSGVAIMLIELEDWK